MVNPECFLLVPDILLAMDKSLACPFLPPTHRALLLKAMACLLIVVLLPPVRDVAPALLPCPTHPLHLALVALLRPMGLLAQLVLQPV